jgi:hypothetical protein
VSGGNESVDGLLGLFDALLGESAHLRGDIEAIGGGHPHLLL